MSTFTGTPEVSVILRGQGTSYKIAVGDTVDSITIEHPYGEDEVIQNATVAAVSLAAAGSPNRSGRIYDGIPTNQFVTDDMAEIRDASVYYVVDEIALKKEDETITVVPVSRIKEITGSFETESGDAVEAVAGNEAAQEALSGKADGSTVVMSDASIETDTTVSTAGGINGENADKPQNYDQKV